MKTTLFLACVLAVTLWPGTLSPHIAAGGAKGEQGVDLPKDDPLLQAIQKRFGKPDRVSGSGRLFIHYDLQNGETLTLIVSGGKVIGAYQADKAGANKDLESLHGTWNIDSMEWGGNSLPKELMNGYKFVFVGNKLTWDAAIGVMSKAGKVSALDGSFACDFKIDAGKNPKHIDITMHLKQGDRTVLGIYEIKGDKLKVCYYSSQTGKRPTEFSTNDNRSIGQITLTRAKK